MASAWGAWQCQYDYRDWRGGVNAWVISETDTTATIRVEARYNSRYARQVNTTYAYTSCDGNNSGWVGTGGLNQPSNTDTTLVRRTQDYIVAKGSSGRNVRCTGGVRIGGTYSPGASDAGVNVWVNAVTVSAPNAPSGASATKNSDYSATIRWTNHPSAPTKPYSNLYVERQTDSGGWTQVAELGGTATSYTDSKITTSHTYRWRVRARNSAGYSGYATTGAVTTSHVPNAPTSCSASRVSDSQAKVTWTNNPSGATRPYSNVLVERQTDTGGWVQVATLGAVGNYTDNGIGANHRYAYRVRARNGAGTSGYSTSGYIYTTPAAPTAVNLSKTSSTTVSVSVSGAAPWATAYEVQYRMGGGSWQNSSTNVTSWPYSHSPGAGTVRYRVRAKCGSLYSGWRESGDITTIVAPLAPSVTVDRQVYTYGSSVTVKWVRNHPDGTSQTSAQVELSGAASGTYDVAGAASSYTLARLADGSYSVRVRTKGLYDGWGAWSSPTAFRIATAPTAVITYPAIDGDAVEVVPFEVSWEVADSTGIAEQTLRLYYETGGLIFETSVPSGTTEYEFGPATYLPQNVTSYVAELTVIGGSSLSTAATRIFSADYAEPARPTAHVTYDDSLTATVEVEHGYPGWTLDGTILVSPEDSVDEEGVIIAGGVEETDTEGILEIGAVLPTVSVSVVRQLPDGTQWLVEDGLADGEVARDPLPPLNTDYIYLVTSYSEAGTATTREVPARVDSNLVALNYGTAASSFIGIPYNVEWSRDYASDWQGFHFADGGSSGGLPTLYSTGSVDVTGQITGYILDIEDARALDECSRLHPIGWVRDPNGYRALCAIDASISEGYPRGVFEASLKLTEGVFDEAW